MDEIKLFYDLLIINIISSSLVGRIKKSKAKYGHWAVVCPCLK